MDVFKTLAKLKAIEWNLCKIEEIKAQEVDMVFLVIIEYRYVVLSRKMQL
jgi:hypothetical protein